LKAFTLGFIVGVVAVVVVVAVYFETGIAPVAASAHPIPFERTLANGALHARIAKEIPKTVPITANEQTYLAAAQIYREHCEVCHGGPAGDQTAIAKGMFPKPPKLLQGKGVTDDEAGETFWKVANGIRLTGMPSFRGPLSDTQMWQVSLLLANADKVPESVKQALAIPAQAAQTTQANK
jgi:thiosulfate dehydrogenase